MSVAEILSIGTELLLGETLDTNATFLSEELRDAGINLFFRTTIGDNLERIVQALKQARQRSDIIITTGGLGPTDGDITREAIAAALEETLEIDSALLHHLETMFSERGRSMAEKNRKQAALIPSAKPLQNPIGTAPGWFVRKDGKIIIALPGPPHEMKKMWKEQALPRMVKPSQGFFSVTLHTLGIGESNLVELLGDLTKMANPTVATYARPTGLDIRIAASAATRADSEILVVPILRKVENAVGRFIFSRNSETLSEVVGNRLLVRGETVSVVEGFTGGLIANILRNHPQFHRFFSGGLVLGTSDILGFSGTPSHPAEGDNSRVSVKSALDLARKVREPYGSTWGIATCEMTQNTTPSGEGTPPPWDMPADSETTGAEMLATDHRTLLKSSTFVAVTGPAGELVEKFDWPGEREYLRWRISNQTLMLLNRCLLAASAANRTPRT